jgi:hypothetical protein
VDLSDTKHSQNVYIKKIYIYTKQQQKGFWIVFGFGKKDSGHVRVRFYEK